MIQQRTILVLDTLIAYQLQPISGRRGELCLPWQDPVWVMAGSNSIFAEENNGNQTSVLGEERLRTIVAHVIISGNSKHGADTGLNFGKHNPELSRSSSN